MPAARLARRRARPGVSRPLALPDKPSHRHDACGPQRPDARNHRASGGLCRPVRNTRRSS
ncbi:hypothetical protein HMPREF0972_00325 [Actinomyces sp. oral taxon 848 str. F0332]|nr:hypothetical protein HMPREF0972_00325 [Actinomyces sp. oral taxon 848 str. F0332]